MPVINSLPLRSKFIPFSPARDAESGLRCHLCSLARFRLCWLRGHRGALQGRKGREALLFVLVVFFSSGPAGGLLVFT